LPCFDWRVLYNLQTRTPEKAAAPRETHAQVHESSASEKKTGALDPTARSGKPQAIFLPNGWFISNYPRGPPFVSEMNMLWAVGRALGKHERGSFACTV
jgi:hypothetical protein